MRPFENFRKFLFYHFLLNFFPQEIEIKLFSLDEMNQNIFEIFSYTFFLKDDRHSIMWKEWIFSDGKLKGKRKLIKNVPIKIHCREYFDGKSIRKKAMKGIFFCYSHENQSKEIFIYCNAKNFLMQAEQFNSRGDDNVS